MFKLCSLYYITYVKSGATQAAYDVLEAAVLCWPARRHTLLRLETVHTKHTTFKPFLSV
jgi:hypothetical protein